MPAPLHSNDSMPASAQTPDPALPTRSVHGALPRAPEGLTQVPDSPAVPFCEDGSPTSPWPWAAGWPEPGSLVGQAPPVVVVDTNVVLDWWVFRGPDAVAVLQAILAGQLRWAVTPRMRDEFRRVLQYKQMKGYEHDPLEALRQFDAAALGVQMPPRCAFKSRDPDDQVFIDLAVACGAKVLLSRDKALLRLAVRARASDLWIGPPEKWWSDPAGAAALGLQRPGDGA